ncbi:MAG TPA: hypothetical protein PK625_01525, partial [Spirochaetales bacterium]|nr:hypothetical protein [Spirochaetales bacterium]
MSRHRAVKAPVKHAEVPRKARITLPRRPEAVLRYEDFIRTVRFLSEREKNVVIVAGEEVVDNLLTHGEVGRHGIKVTVRKRASGITLALYVQSHRIFARFSACLDLSPPPGPRYNSELKRWHGLGLTMSRNLARSVCYRPGEQMDRVYL